MYCALPMYFMEAMSTVMECHKNEDIADHVCQTCSRQFSTASELSTHEESDHARNCCYLCSDCAASFNTRQELEEHMNSHNKCESLHDEQSDTTPTSGIYSDASSEPSPLAINLTNQSAHSNADCCPPELVRKTKGKSTAIANGNTTKGSKSGYYCRLCFKSFPSRSLLNVHYTHTHRDKPQYECEYCGQIFTVKRELATHRRIHSGEPLHACGICGKVFGTKQLLKKHYVWHTGNRDYVCPKCDKAFYQKGHLTQHMMIHTGGRPHVCKLCHKTFIFKFDLNRHLKIHAERGQSCMYCSEGFDQPAALIEHLKTCGKKRKAPSQENGSDDTKPKRSRKAKTASPSTESQSPAGSLTSPVVGHMPSPSALASVMSSFTSSGFAPMFLQFPVPMSLSMHGDAATASQMMLHSNLQIKQDDSATVEDDEEDSPSHEANSEGGRHENEAGDDGQEQDEEILSEDFSFNELSSDGHETPTMSMTDPDFAEAGGSPSACVQCGHYQNELMNTRQRVAELERQLMGLETDAARGKAELANREVEIGRLRERMVRVGSMAGSLLEMCSDFDKVWMMHSKKVYNHIQSLLHGAE